MDAPTCAEAGVLGPAAGVIGSLQALEALKFLTGAARAAARRVPQHRPRHAASVLRVNDAPAQRVPGLR